MAVYVMYRAFTTLVILPFAAGLFSPEWTRSVFLVLIAMGATILSFTRYKGIAASLAIILGLLALGSWARIIFVAPVWTRSYLVWSVLPELCFSVAGLCKWWVRPYLVERET